MKKICLSILGFLSGLFSLQGQHALYGTTSNGGSHGGGTISKYRQADSTLSSVYDFESVGSSPFFVKFIQASNGKLYGTTASGGKGDYGTILSYDPITGTYAKLKDF